MMLDGCQSDKYPSVTQGPSFENNRQRLSSTKPGHEKMLKMPLVHKLYLGTHVSNSFALNYIRSYFFGFRQSIPAKKPVESAFFPVMRNSKVFFPAPICTGNSTLSLLTLVLL